MSNNAFYRFCCGVFVAGVCLIYYVNFRKAIVSGDILDFVTAAAALALAGLILLMARRRQRKHLKNRRKHNWKSDDVGAIVIFALYFLLAIPYVLRIHETPQMDFRRYYDVAQMLTEGYGPAGVDYRDGMTYLEILSVFPFTVGFSRALSLVFHVTGVSWRAAELLNVFCSAVSGLILYRIAKAVPVTKDGDRTAQAVLILALFWPSMFLYSNMIASESLFTMLLMICIWIFVGTTKQLDNGAVSGRKGHVVCITAAAGIGILLGLASQIRSMAILLLITLLLIMGLSSKDFFNHRVNGEQQQAEQQGKGKRQYRFLLLLLSAILMVASYSVVKSALDWQNERWIGPTAASTSSGGGNSFMIGMNTSTDGSDSQDDLAFMLDVFRETNSGTIAQDRCFEAGMERLKSLTFPEGMELFLNKYTKIWGDDDIGARWNKSLMSLDGTLTDSWRMLWNTLGRVSTLLYLIAAGLAAVHAGSMIREERVDLPSMIFIILTLGCAATHTIMEVQTRYHYYVLYGFIYLAVIGSRKLLNEY